MADPLEEEEVLTREEIRSLRISAPARLFRHLSQVEREFLFGVAARRKHEEEWGGEYEVTLNRNLTLHFVPRFNEAMTKVEELPQFTVFPSAVTPDTARETELRLEEDDETIQGVVFYVDPADYAQMCEELAEVEERYGDIDIVPDTYFIGTTVVDFLTRVVLEHPTVRIEREYDFRRGLVGGLPPSDEPLDEPPLERIEDVEDPDVEEELLGGAPAGAEPELEYEVTEGEHLRTIRFKPPPPP